MSTSQICQQKPKGTAGVVRGSPLKETRGSRYKCSSNLIKEETPNTFFRDTGMAVKKSYYYYLQISTQWAPMEDFVLAVFQWRYSENNSRPSIN